MLEIKNLTKYYGKKRGIENINIKINDGEIFGFIGPNGAGKSTTIKCILNMLNYTSGEILLNNNRITDNDKKYIGYLPSEIHLYENYKTGDLIKYNDSFYSFDTLKKANKLVDYFDVDINKRIDELSLGNLKKIGIILSVVHNPKLLILDEPTSGLDPLIQEKFFSLLEEEKKNGTTIFFSSHNLSEIKKICDKVAVIRKGQIIEINNVSKLSEKSFVNIKLKANGINTIKFNSKKIKIKKLEKNYLECIYYDKIDSFIKLINQLTVQQLFIEEPSLEEIFMHYYKED